MNYLKLMNSGTYELGKMVNHYGQTIHFYEHPTLGEDAPVIAVCHDLEIASSTDFHDVDDMMSPESTEYYPVFKDMHLYYGHELG